MEILSRNIAVAESTKIAPEEANKVVLDPEASQKAPYRDFAPIWHSLEQGDMSEGGQGWRAREIVISTKKFKARPCVLPKN